MDGCRSNELSTTLTPAHVFPKFRNGGSLSEQSLLGHVASSCLSACLIHAGGWHCYLSGRSLVSSCYGGGERIDENGSRRELLRPNVPRLQTKATAKLPTSVEGKLDSSRPSKTPQSEVSGSEVSLAAATCTRSIDHSTYSHSICIAISQTNNASSSTQFLAICWPQNLHRAPLRLSVESSTRNICKTIPRILRPGSCCRSQYVSFTSLDGHERC